LESTINSLKEMPVGRVGKISGVLEKVVPKTSLIIAFELPNPNTIHILRVIHTSRYWPEEGWPD
jgi:toxin ParE1/3/4